jgi:hypothetical protein
MLPTIGRILLYTLTADDAQKVNRRRTTGAAIAERMRDKRWPEGAQAHIGSTVNAGEQYPLIVTATYGQGKIGGQVFLDGNDTYWVSEVIEGAGEGEWMWPPRVS